MCTRAAPLSLHAIVPCRAQPLGPMLRRPKPLEGSFPGPSPPLKAIAALPSAEALAPLLPRPSTLSSAVLMRSSCRPWYTIRTRDPTPHILDSHRKTPTDPNDNDAPTATKAQQARPPARRACSQEGKWIAYQGEEGRRHRDMEKRGGTSHVVCARHTDKRMRATKEDQKRNSTCPAKLRVTWHGRDSDCVCCWL